MLAQYLRQHIELEANSRIIDGECPRTRTPTCARNDKNMPVVSYILVFYSEY